MSYKQLETANKPRKQKRWLSYIMRNTTHSSLDLVLQREINAKGLDSYGLLRWQTKYCVPIYELFSPLKKSTTFFSKISDTDSVETICLHISDRSNLSKIERSFQHTVKPKYDLIILKKLVFVYFFKRAANHEISYFSLS